MSLIDPGGLHRIPGLCPAEAKHVEMPWWRRFIPVDKTCGLSAPVETKQKPEPDGGGGGGRPAALEASLATAPIPLAAVREPPQEPTCASGQTGFVGKDGGRRRGPHLRKLESGGKFSLLKLPYSPKR